MENNWSFLTLVVRVACTSQGHAALGLKQNPDALEGYLHKHFVCMEEGAGP